MTIEKRSVEPAATGADLVVVANAAKADAEVILSISQAFKVETAEDFQAANSELQIIKKKAKEIEAKRQELKAPVLEVGRKIDEMFRPALAVLLAAEDAIKRQMISWQREQERIRREEEERQRKEIEKAERARQRALESGDEKKVEKAEAKVAQAAATMVAAPPPPKAKGFYVTEVWSAEVYDFMSLVKAVAAGKVHASLLMPNQKALDELAKGQKDQMNVPGVKSVKRDSAGSRSV